MQEKSIENALKERILILDGATGTMIQREGLTEKDFTHPKKGLCRGLNDLLNISRPDVIEKIHQQYLDAGADIITTNTFSANSISLKDYGMESYVREINICGAKIAKNIALKYSTSQKKRYVAGDVGPTGRSASISPSVEDSSVRNVTFDQLYASYCEQISALVEGGVDLILIETSFDALNAKAAVKAAKDTCSLPIMLSGTIADASGRLLSGQTVEAFCASFASMGLFSIGLNCAMGADELKKYVRRLSEVAPLPVSSHPNAGLPDGFGGYAQSEEETAKCVEQYMSEGLVNIIGGCCGTTPKYIQLLSKAAQKYSPRTFSTLKKETILAGLEPFEITPQANFVSIGERANVAGSAKFACLVREGAWNEAVEIVRKQVQDGAQIIDVCMDAPMIDAKEAMAHFLRLIASEPDIAKLPVMIDSSDWNVLLEGMKCVQGKHIVNSISLKEGEKTFLEHAKTIHSLGHAAVVMLFDENGQADTYQRKVDVAQRMYRLLLKNGFDAHDIIFDPNILSVATGMPQHDAYAEDFIRATAEIKRTCPGVKISGGVSNLSFSFRGNNTVREAMHSVFLYHAIHAGMDMGIVNAGMIQVYSDIEKELLRHVEDVILNKDPAAGERLIAFAQTLQNTEKTAPAHIHKDVKEIYPDVTQRLIYKIVKGLPEEVEADALLSLEEKKSPVKVIDEVLMKGMSDVGELFGEGKMFLPQVVKSARVMKMAVDALTPYMEIKNATIGKKKVILATVKGDVHDIGKNIVGVVLACNGYQVIDMGVMVDPNAIVERAEAENVDIIGLSGLITPSLSEMANVLKALEYKGLTIPVMIGGATTSALHTAVKLAPLYSGQVAYCTDASSDVKTASLLLSGKDFKEDQKNIRDDYQASMDAKAPLVSLSQARENAPKYTYNVENPHHTGVFLYENYPLEKLQEQIDWSFFFLEWGIKGRYPDIFADAKKGEEAKKLHADALVVLDEMKHSNILKANGIAGIFTTQKDGDDIVINSSVRFPFFRNQKRSFSCLSDFIAPQNDYIGVFAVTAGIGLDEFCKDKDQYTTLLAKTLANRLAEAFSQTVYQDIKTNKWGFSTQGIRPACGYPVMIDHSEKQIIFSLLDATKNTGITLTDSYMMMPEASVSGLIFAHEKAHYFAVGEVSDEQIKDYSYRRGISVEDAKKYCGL
ncbi:MAG: methionine synthase [Flavobacteriales bacterium]|nr:methionine synthase [Flavobacteriales bacterium]